MEASFPVEGIVEREMAGPGITHATRAGGAGC